MFARVGTSAPMEGAEQDLIELGLVESVARVKFARLERNVSKIDALSLIFLPVQSVVLMMFVRPDTSAPMEDANPINRAVLTLAFLVVESVDMEMFVRPDISVSMVGAIKIAFALVESANTEIFARLDISVSTVGATQITSVLVECAG